MNLRDSFRRHKLIIFVLFVLIMWIVWANERTLRKPRWHSEMEGETILGAIQEAVDDLDLRRAEKEMKEIEYEELSPDQSRKAVLYKMLFDSNLYNGYYNDYFYNKMIVAAVDIEGQREYYVFTGEERTGNPHWLGNNYVFFTTYCGTACKGLYLIDIRNKETLLTTLSYIFSYEKGAYDTHLRDWFGQEFVFEGIVEEIRSETVGDNVYLIFKMKNNQGHYLYEKQFLFTGNSLEALN